MVAKRYSHELRQCRFFMCKCRRFWVSPGGVQNLGLIVSHQLGFGRGKIIKYADHPIANLLLELMCSMKAIYPFY